MRRIPWVSALLLAVVALVVAELPPLHTPLSLSELTALYATAPPYPRLDPSSTADDAILAPLLIPRVPGSHNSTLVQEHILAHFSALGNWSVQVDAFTGAVPDAGGVAGALQFSNLVFTLAPPEAYEDERRGASAQSQFLTFAAHYDSKLTPSGFIGATDSAVPCAILLQLATALTKPLLARFSSPSSADDDSLIGLQIIFTDGEEALVEWTDTDSLYGARHLAELWESDRVATPHGGRFSELQRIELFVLLDLLGAANPAVPCYFPTTRWACQELAAAERSVREAGLARSSTNSVGFMRAEKMFANAFIGDDHVPFMQRGVPVLHVIPVPFPKVWHTLDDDAAHLDDDAVHDWAVFVTAWVAGYLGLGKYL
ncbi:peptidase family M28-domain-containing protein [Limtongia smithiae]|uniref:peptidase family M28-domain-containing protein n=1 Tax=Limtongia smithiae TaxID=1125753 RepID=UPI0034CFE7A8